MFQLFGAFGCAAPSDRSIRAAPLRRGRVPGHAAQVTRLRAANIAPEVLHFGHPRMAAHDHRFAPTERTGLAGQLIQRFANARFDDHREQDADDQKDRPRAPQGTTTNALAAPSRWAAGITMRDRPAVGR